MELRHYRGAQIKSVTKTRITNHNTLDIDLLLRVFGVRDEYSYKVKYIMGLGI